MNQAIVIIIFACNNLMADPETGKQPKCEEFPLVFTKAATAIQCIMHSQIEVAKLWWPTHQNWVIKRITCKEKKSIINDESSQEDI